MQQLECFISEQQSDDVSALLENAGAVAITFTDAKDHPIYEPEIGTTPLWQSLKLTALFEEQTNLQTLLNTLNQSFSIQATTYRLENKVWERVCMDEFQPIPVGDKLWICPSWHNIDDKTATIVHLDPGLAFGTGSHPTTHLCLEWLATQNLINKTLIDYGCGSGILAIAGAKLGAKKVYAIDIDPQALLATHENKQRNQLDDHQIVTGMPEDLPPLQVNILLANILANPLISLADRFMSLTQTHGEIILTGILKDQIPAVCQAYQSHCEIREIRTRGDWGLIHFIKQSA